MSVARLCTLLLPFLFFVACNNGDGEDPVPTVISASRASVSLVDDPTNRGNAADLFVAFSKGADEATISEYRVVVVKNENMIAFSLEVAEALSESRYKSVSPNGNDQEANLSADLMDSDGAAIVEGRPYVVFIMSVADGVNATENSLSAVSLPIELAQHAIKIT